MRDWILKKQSDDYFCLLPQHLFVKIFSIFIYLPSLPCCAAGCAVTRPNCAETQLNTCGEISLCDPWTAGPQPALGRQCSRDKAMRRETKLRCRHPSRPGPDRHSRAALSPARILQFLYEGEIWLGESESRFLGSRAEFTFSKCSCSAQVRCAVEWGCSSVATTHTG